MHVTLHYIALHYITLHCITYVRSVGVPDAPVIQSIRSVAIQASEATRFQSQRLVRGRPGARDILDIRYKLYIYIYI